jgi:hypothetical protein
MARSTRIRSKFLEKYTTRLTDAPELDRVLSKLIGCVCTRFGLHVVPRLLMGQVISKVFGVIRVVLLRMNIDY